jgi:single-stranded-DNA-specific exonuclease
MNNWQLESKTQITNVKQQLIEVLLKNRGIKTKKETEEFLNPRLSEITPLKLGIDIKNLYKAYKRIKKAISKNEKIIIYGDYDVDGVCASAILWETLNKFGANVLPFIPSRFEEGYGLSIEGIEVLIEKENPGLIITVDNGIVASQAVDYANKKGIEVIITDHHTPLSGGSKNLPKAFSIVHTTKLCGAGVAYLLAKEFKIEQDDHLELVALATVADLVPLISANRAFVYHGLKALRNTKRLGLLTLIERARIDKFELGVYEIGHIIAPRLNAMGRLENAMDSLRLICTTNKKRAESLSKLLSDTNFTRAQITIEAYENAKKRVKDKNLKKLIFIADKSFAQGIVGLVAGRLVEEFYLPSIVVSKGEKFSKASARSIKGFNITEFLRTASDLLVDVGGHPMAAGFTVETDKIELLEKKLLVSIEKLLDEKHLQRSLRIDIELPQSYISQKTYEEIQRLAPYGMGNPEPTFLTKNLLVEDLRLVGNDGKHLKLKLKTDPDSFGTTLNIEGIYFKGGENNKIRIGDKVDAVYTLDENKWNGNKSLQLKIKDMHKV